MKPFLPFALLGSVGVAGVVVGTGAVDAHLPKTAASSLARDLGPVKVEASLERTHLVANAAGETFARVALTGVASQQKTQRVPVSLTLVIDRSGSMGSEQKMEAAEDAACKALQELQNGDRYSAVSFDNGAEVLIDNSVVGDGAGVANGCRTIAELFARGSTDMRSGLQVGGEQAQKMFAAGRVNRILLLSDGQPDTEAGLADQTKALAKVGITTTTIGLGTDYNEDLMAKVADAGLGNSWFVESRKEMGGGAAQLAKIFQTELKSMAEVVAKNASITLTPKNGLEIVDVTGFTFDRSGNKFVIPVGDVYGGRTTDVLVKVRHAAQQEGVQDVLDVDVGFNAAADNAAYASTLAVNATFTKDTGVVAASTVADVAVKAAEWQTSTAMLQANEAYNRGDFKAGDGILAASKADMKEKAKALKTDKLDNLMLEVDSYQSDNAAGGMGARANMNKKAKQMARDVSRASGSYKK